MFFIEYIREKRCKQNMKITFRGNVVVREDFLSTDKKTVDFLSTALPGPGSAPGFWGALPGKFSHCFRDVENLNVSSHLVNIKGYNLVFLFNYNAQYNLRIFFKLKKIMKKANLVIKKNITMYCCVGFVPSSFSQWT